MGAKGEFEVGSWRVSLFVGEVDDDEDEEVVFLPVRVPQRDIVGVRTLDHDDGFVDKLA